MSAAQVKHILFLCFLGIQVCLLLCCSSPVGPSQVVARGGRLRVRSRDQGFARGQNHRLLNSNYPQFFCLYNPLLGKHSKGRTFLAIVGLKWCCCTKRGAPKKEQLFSQFPLICPSLPLRLVERDFLLSWGWRQIKKTNIKYNQKVLEARSLVWGK